MTDDGTLHRHTCAPWHSVPFATPRAAAIYWDGAEGDLAGGDDEDAETTGFQEGLISLRLDTGFAAMFARLAALRLNWEKS